MKNEKGIFSWIGTGVFTIILCIFLPILIVPEFI